ncbi:hypothetical protein SEA_SPARCETUS_73 [Microbacterium phage Sparcetus]|nr:hypothetical protein SEA_SPARCETUS_73 [Microbacterium phage Sparcetus]
MSTDKVEGVAKILAGAHPAESLGNIAREIIKFLEPERTESVDIDSEVEKVLASHPGLVDEHLDDVVAEAIQHGMALRPKHTAWIPIDLMFRDRYNGLVRHAPYMLVEVVKHGNEVLFQDAENGTHRMVALQHIENTRAAVEIEKKRILEETGL